MNTSKVKKLLKSKEGISPVIATIIMVAVTVGISIAVGGWLVGLWGGYTKTETVKILADSNYTAGGTSFTLNVKNDGTANAKITKVVIGSNTYTTSTGITINAASSATLTDGDLPGGTHTTPFSAGTVYEVRIYTEAGNVYIGSITG